MLYLSRAIARAFSVNDNSVVYTDVRCWEGSEPAPSVSPEASSRRLDEATTTLALRFTIRGIDGARAVSLSSDAQQLPTAISIFAISGVLYKSSSAAVVSISSALCPFPCTACVRADATSCTACQAEYFLNGDLDGVFRGVSICYPREQSSHTVSDSPSSRLSSTALVVLVAAAAAALIIVGASAAYLLRRRRLARSEVTVFVSSSGPAPMSTALHAADEFALHSVSLVMPMQEEATSGPRRSGKAMLVMPKVDSSGMSPATPMSSSRASRAGNEFDDVWKGRSRASRHTASHGSSVSMATRVGSTADSRDDNASGAGVAASVRPAVSYFDADAPIHVGSAMGDGEGVGAGAFVQTLTPTTPRRGDAGDERAERALLRATRVSDDAVLVDGVQALDPPVRGSPRTPKTPRKKRVAKKRPKGVAGAPKAAKKSGGSATPRRRVVRRSRSASASAHRGHRADSGAPMTPLQALNDVPFVVPSTLQDFDVAGVCRSESDDDLFGDERVGH